MITSYRISSHKCPGTYSKFWQRGGALIGRRAPFKKLLTCTDSVVVDALKFLDQMATDICSPCIPTF